MSYITSREVIKPVSGLDHSVAERHHSKIPITGPLMPRCRSLAESSESEEECNSLTVERKISNQSLVDAISREFSVTSPVYHEYYSLSNSSYCPYKTVFPDVSQFSFEDSENEVEDSEYSSVFHENDLATKVKILEAKFDIVFRQRNREREEMMRLHQAMVKLVTDLVDVVSPPTSLLPCSSSPLKPEPAVQPSLHYTGKEPQHVASKEDHCHTRQSKEVRKEQLTTMKTSLLILRNPTLR